MGISTVTSEALQLKLRQLLPSQQGFGTDLSASDTIIPVIDLTQAAEGSDTPRNLQEALSFGSQTSFNISNATTVIINTTGFYRIFGVSSAKGSTSIFSTASFILSDGLSIKTIWSQSIPNTAGVYGVTISYDFIVFLAAGEDISGTSNTVDANLLGSARQIADVNGTLVNPVGFNPQ